VLPERYPGLGKQASMQWDMRVTASELKGHRGQALCRTHSLLTEEGLEQGPVSGHHSCFSSPPRGFLLSPVLLRSYPDRWSHPGPLLPLPPRVLADDHMHRYGPASVHRHNGEAPLAPGRLAESSRRPSASAQGRRVPSKGATEGVLSFFPGPRERGQQVEKEVGAVLHKLSLGPQGS